MNLNRRLLNLSVCLLLATVPAFARARVNGWCEKGNEPVVTSGSLNSTTKVQRSYPACTVNVYLTGTTTLASIYSDNSGTPKANPFTATSVGAWFFYSENGAFDVTLSGGGLSTYTIGAVSVYDPATQPYITSAPYLADPTGATDSLAAINACLAANGVCRVPTNSTFSLISGGLSITTAGRGLLCDPGSLIRYTGTSNINGAVMLGNGTGGVYRLVLRGCAIAGNSHTLAALYANQIAYSQLSDIAAYQVGGSGDCFHLLTGNTNTFDNPSGQGIFQGPHPCTRGLVFDTTLNWIVTNPKFEEVVNEGILFISSGANTVTGGTSEGNGTGVSVGVGCYGNILLNIDTEADSVASYVDNGNGTTWISGNLGEGVVEVGPTAVNSTILNMIGNYTRIDAGAKATYIQGGTINNNATGGLIDLGTCTTLISIQGGNSPAVSMLPGAVPSNANFFQDRRGVCSSTQILGAPLSPVTITRTSINTGDVGTLGADTINIGSKAQVAGPVGVNGPSAALYTNAYGNKATASINLCNDGGADNALTCVLVDNEGVAIPTIRGMTVTVLTVHTLRAGTNTFALNGVVKPIFSSHTINNITLPYSVQPSLVRLTYHDSWDAWLIDTP